MQEAPPLEQTLITHTHMDYKRKNSQILSSSFGEDDIQRFAKFTISSNCL